MALNNQTGPEYHWTGELRLAPQTDNDGAVIGGGVVPPHMTTAERDAVDSPREGAVIYNTTTNKLNFYNGTAWEAVTSA